MHQFKNLSIVLIASTLLVVGPILGCCSGMINFAPSNKMTSFDQSSVVAPDSTSHHSNAQASNSKAMEMPCHDMVIGGEQSISQVPDDKIDTISENGSSHCHNCTDTNTSDGCATTKSDAEPVFLAANTLNDSAPEPIYLLLLLDFPEDIPVVTGPEGPPNDWHPLVSTPITLHQVLII